MSGCDEADILDKAFDVRAGSRLGCQSKIEREGVLEVEITRESVQAYENEHPEARGRIHGYERGRTGPGRRAPVSNATSRCVRPRLNVTSLSPGKRLSRYQRYSCSARTGL